jgi:hypothetical protein
MINEWIQTQAMLLSTTQTMATLALPIGRDRGRNVTGHQTPGPSQSCSHGHRTPTAASGATFGDQPSYCDHLRLSRMTAMDQSDDQRPSPSASWDSDGFRAKRVASHVVAPV